MTNSNPPPAARAESGQIDRPWRFFGRWILALVFILNAVFPLGGWRVAGLETNVPAAIAASSNLVISQFYTDGGFNASSAYRNDFVEIFNRGNATVDLSGYSVQYASNSANATGNFNQVATLSGNLAPGQYYLIQGGGGTNTTPPTLPAPDATFTTNLNFTIGRVAIISGTTALNCGGPTGSTGTPCDTTQLTKFVDLVGYGSSYGTPNNEGGTGNFAAAPGVSSAIRGGNGCTDTDNNASDFSTASAVTPRNKQSTLNPCSTGGNQPPVINAPANPITTVAQNSTPFTVTLSGTDDGGIYNWSATAGLGLTSVAVSGTANTSSVVFTVSVQSGFTGTAFFTATLSDGVNPAVNQRVNIQVGATGPGGGLTPIYTIQGAGQNSPLTGQTITTTGVVIGTKSSISAKSNGAPDGYFIQDPTGDGNINTSDGIFVFLGTGASNAPNKALLNHLVQVKGKVAEYASSGSLAFTELGSTPVVTDLGVFTGTITPTVITANPAKAGVGTTYVRLIPSTTVVSSTAGYNPAVNAVDFYESMESMLVQVDDGLVVGPTNAYGETVIQPDLGVGGSPRNARGTLYLTPNDVNPDRVMIAADLDVVGRDNAPIANVGDTIPGSLVGPFDYNFSNYKIDVNKIVTGTDINRSNEVTQEVLPALSSPTQLRVASYNIENFIQHPMSTTDQLRRTVIARDIAFNLASPDLLVINEIQDNSGSTDDGTTNSDTQLNNLVVAIQAQGGANYSYRYVVPNNDTDGGEPGGNIRQVFLYRTDRGLQFVDKPGATANVSNTVLSDGSLQYSPGRISPNDPAFITSRKPLAGEFLFQGKRLIVIGNHLNSKGGDDPIYGKNQPPVLSSETQRRAQATIIRDFVSQIQTANPAAYVVVAGDLNDFQWSNPVKILKNGNGTITDTSKILYDTVEDYRIPTDDRYSYVYEGNAQTLDHILFSQPMTTSVVSLDMVHLNSEFSNDDPRRATDHDPPTAVFDFGGSVPGCLNPYVVTQTLDSGSGGCGSLSFAIQTANTVTNTNLEISFAGAGNVITTTGALPAIAPLNGSTISFNGGGTCGPTQVGTPGLTLKGTGGNSVGITLTGNSTVKGLAVTGFSSYGLVVTGANNKIICSWVGASPNVTGTTANGNGIRLGIAGGLAATNTTLSNDLVSSNNGVGIQVENGVGNTMTYTWVGLAGDGTPLRNTGGALKVLAGGQIKPGAGNIFRG